MSAEIAASLHRLRSRKGRCACVGWYRTARQQLRDKGLERVLRRVVLPLYPRAAYFPDFLTPADAVGDFDTGMEAIVATPPQASWRSWPSSTGRERVARCRGLLDGGVQGMLSGLGPMLRRRPPVLEVSYPNPPSGTARPYCTRSRPRGRPCSGPAREDPADATAHSEGSVGWMRRRNVALSGVSRTRSRRVSREPCPSRFCSTRRRP